MVRTSIALLFIVKDRFRRGFHPFFRKGLLVQKHYIVLILWLDGATRFAKLRSKVSKSPKIGGKVCAHVFV